MIVVIDATNLRDGGGITHLKHILQSVDTSFIDDLSVIVLGSNHTLSQLPNRTFVQKKHFPVFEKGFVRRTYWLFFYLKKYLYESNADILFSPGGSLFTNFHPTVTMSRNSLPVELGEAKRYGLSIMLVRLLLLRYLQKLSFFKSDGYIFLTEYAKNNFIRLGWLNPVSSKPQVTIIPHGVEAITTNYIYNVYRDSFTERNPFKILYLSIIDVYKHQDKVVQAVVKLRAEGLHIELHLVGPYYKPAFKKFQRLFSSLLDEHKNHIIYHGPLNRIAQLQVYPKMDLCLFASSCENMPNILLENMSSSIPIASSNKGPMPQILEGSAILFDPESVDSISNAIRAYYISPDYREYYSKLSFAVSKKYNWEKSATETFLFLKKFI